MIVKIKQKTKDDLNISSNLNAFYTNTYIKNVKNMDELIKIENLLLEQGNLIVSVEIMED